MVVDPYSGLRQSHLLEDGHIRCKQLTMLLEWVEEFEAESHQNGDAVAFSVLLGDLNFDNCSQGKKLVQVEPRDPALPTKKWFSSTEHAKEQGHKFFSSFQDPCRLGPCQEQSWALGTVSGEAGEQACGMCQLGCLPLIDSALPGPHRDNLKLLHATPLYCLLPRDASEGLAEGKRAPPLPGRTPSWKLLSSLLEGPASGLHHLPWSTRESPESSKCLNFGLLGLL